MIMKNFKGFKKSLQKRNFFQICLGLNLFLMIFGWVIFILFSVFPFSTINAENRSSNQTHALPDLKAPVAPSGLELFTKEEFAARRQRLMEKIPDGFAVVRGADYPPGDYYFLQNTNFFYFTGLEIPGATLIMDGDSGESLLFFTITEREADGMGLSLDLVRNPEEYTGIKRIYPSQELSPWLSRLARGDQIIYTPFSSQELSRENTREKFNVLQENMTLNLWDSRLTREFQFVNLLKKRFPGAEIKDASPLIWELRMIKSPAEINVLRRSAQIGVLAHKAVMQSTRPDVSEQELAAVFDFICQSKGSRDLAFYIILMSGKNHAYGHYHVHDRILQDGDFIILDAGPDFGYYHADISSTFPANGHFSPEQRRIYEVALGIRNVCQENYAPGITFREIGQKVKEYLEREGIDSSSRQYRGEIRYGGYNHMIGLATHDVTSGFKGPDEVLKPGFVFACDIGISYPEKKIGIRLEDTVAITEHGFENLSAGIPREVEDIEAFMKKKGVLQILKDAGKL